ncbi:MAG TPA: hypothetical protein ENH23_07295 [candidate division Zixibacteria bacterium]|nr:hypothetical protein [candidate division Zixibacteria bacterium]
MIDLLDIKKISSTIIDLFEMPLEDVDVIPEHIGSMVNNSFETIEVLQSKIGHEIFSYTEQEQLFFDSFNNNFQENQARAEKHFNNLLNKSTENKNQNRESNLELTCFGYIRAVELNLRKLIKQQYRSKYADNWVIALQESIGEIAYQNASDTMKKRKVADNNELIYFTTLPDLQRAIIQKWEIFKDIIPFKKKELNSLLAPILKGRTEEAHNRPKHLWSEIEQQRVRVACNDLLLKIKQS